MHVEQTVASFNPGVGYSCTSDPPSIPVGKIVLLRVGSEVDLAALPALQAALKTNLDQQPDHLLIDLSRVTYCCARGMDLLVTTAGYAAAQGVGYALSGMPVWLDHVWRIFFNDESLVRYRSTAAALTFIKTQQTKVVLTDHPVRRGPLRSVPTSNPGTQRDGRMLRVVPGLGGVETTRLREVSSGSEPWDKRAVAVLRRRAESVIRPSQGSWL